MCGMTGIIARKPVGLNGREMDLMEQMLVINTLRGKDSLGVMTAFRDKEAMIIKHASGIPELLFRTTEWGKFRNRAIGNGRFVMGHNRAATRGTINNDNAHPFVENHIILMHNGTLPNSGSNLTTEKVDVDSHAICHALAAGEPKDVIPKIKGAYALIWYNTQTEKLYAIRNDERTLHVITTEDYFFLSSEAWIAAMPAQRQNRTIKQVDLMEPGDLYEWNLQGKMEVSTLEFPKDPVVESYADWHGQGKYYERMAQANQGDEDNNVPFEMGVTKTTPPEIQSLQDALALRPDKKPIHSASCALTSPVDSLKSTSTTKSDSNGSSKDTPDGPGPVASTNSEIERIASQQRSITIDHPDFPKDAEIMVKVWQIQKLPNNQLKWTGKVVHPDKDMIDAQGFLPVNIPPAEWSHWIETVCVGRVAWCTKTMGGPTVFIRGTERIPYTDIHGADIPVRLWDYAQSQCTCSECQGHIEPWEKVFTHVKMKGVMGVSKNDFGGPTNQIRVVCPDCLMKVLPEGEIYDRYVSKYYLAKNAIYSARKTTPPKTRKTTPGNLAVPTGQQLSTESGKPDDRTPAIQSTQTLQ
jgi:hypothetical protein